MNANDRSIVGFVMLAHGTLHTYELSIPILMTIWLLEFSVTAAVLGAIVSIGYGLYGVGALPSGVLVDAYGSRSLIIVSLAGMAGSFVLLGLSPDGVTLAVSLGLWGIAASIYHPAGLALISKGVTERGSAFAYHGMAGNVGIALGPLATALLLLVFEWRVVAALLAVPAIVAVAVGLATTFDETAAVELADGGRETRDRSDGFSLAGFVDDTRLLFTAGFALVCVIVAFNGLYYRGILTFLPDLLGDVLVGLVGEVNLVDPDSPMAEAFDLGQYLYVGLLVVGIGGQYIGGELTERVRTERGLVAVFGALALIALAYVPAADVSVAAFVAVNGLLGFVLFAIQPLMQATIAEYSPPEARGLSYGYTFLAIFGVGAVGAAIAGVALTYASVTILFFTLACVAAAGCALSLLLARRD